MISMIDLPYLVKDYLLIFRVEYLWMIFRHVASSLTNNTHLTININNNNNNLPSQKERKKEKIQSNR